MHIMRILMYTGMQSIYIEIIFGSIFKSLCNPRPLFYQIYIVWLIEGCSAVSFACSEWS